MAKMKLNVNKGIIRLYIIYAVIATSVFGYFSWTDHWYKLSEDRYYAYIPEPNIHDLGELCRPCGNLEYLENHSGILLDITDDFEFFEKFKVYGNQLDPWQPKHKNYILHYALNFEPMPPSAKFIPVTMKIVENGEMQLLKSQDENFELKADFEIRMDALRKSSVKAADKMRSGYNNSLEHLIHDFMYLFGMLVMPVLLYGLYLWVRRGFDSSK
jgi:hypothetical protein